MKHLIFTAAAFLASSAAFADVSGVWVTEVSERTGHAGHVEIKPCGNAYCGVMIGNSAGSDSYKGTKMIWDMVTSDGVHFSGGKIHDPVSGKTYKSKMTLNGNSLKVEGCVGPICRAQNWKRK